MLSDLWDKLERSHISRNHIKHGADNSLLVSSENRDERHGNVKDGREINDSHVTSFTKPDMSEERGRNSISTVTENRCVPHCLTVA